MKEFSEFIKLNEDVITDGESKNYNSLVFAFIGDAVFSLYVRNYLASRSTAKAGVLHIETVKFVRARYQKYLLEQIYDKLRDDEKMVSETARNSRTNNIAKNSNIEEYKKSTSFEAVLGYLYLIGKTERLYEILKICRTFMEKDL